MLAVVVLLASWAGLCASAAATEDPRATADPTTFISKAIQAGTLEIELGMLAQRMGKSSDVKAFGKRMVSDHGKANAELTKLARARNLKVAQALDAEQRTVVDELRASSADFDAKYAEHMVTDHFDAVALFTQASESQEPDIAAFATRTLPTLKDHKNEADALASKLAGKNAPSAHSASEQ